MWEVIKGNKFLGLKGRSGCSGDLETKKPVEERGEVECRERGEKISRKEHGTDLRHGGRRIVKGVTRQLTYRVLRKSKRMSDL